MSKPGYNQGFRDGKAHVPMVSVTDAYRRGYAVGSMHSTVDLEGPETDTCKGEDMSLTELKCTQKAWITLAKTALTAHCRDHGDCFGCVLATGQGRSINGEGGRVEFRNDCQSRQLLRAEIAEDV